MSGNFQDNLRKVRKPRVHITYDVEVGGAAVKRELPFVIGVMGDFSGDPTKPLAPLADRSFVNIDRDNFDAVMARMNPGLKLRVDNKLSQNGGEMPVDLKFNSLADFQPAAVAEQVPALKALMETRSKLRDLMAKADRSEELETLLENILQNKESLHTLSSHFGIDPDKD